MVKKYQRHYYIITLNRLQRPVEVELDLSPLGVKSAVTKVMFEGDKVPVKDAILRGRNQALQRHIYLPGAAE